MFWIQPSTMRGKASCGNPMELFDRFLAGTPSAYTPAVDVVDSETEAVLVVDIPGVPQGGVDLSIEKNVLTLTAVPEDGVIARKKTATPEDRPAEYRRSFALSDDIDKDAIGATLKDGVLRVRLPKRVQATKKISVVAN